MLWSLILPALVTLVALPPVVLYLFLRRRRGGDVWRRMFWALLVTVFAFVPTCSGIKLVVDKFRFREHVYEGHDVIGDYRVKRYLPPVSSELHVYKTGSGFYASYKAQESQLEDWMKEYSVRTGCQIIDSIGSFNSVGSITGWRIPPDLQQLGGCLFENGAGFVIWFSPSQGEIYQFSPYW